MSRTNAFAIFDDSDDEAPMVVASTIKKESKSITQKSSKKSVSNSSAQEGNKSRSRGSNNDRHTKGGRGPRSAREGKRTFDRRSGTGRGKEIKKDGGGAHNWGSDKNDAKEAEGVVDENEIKNNEQENEETVAGPTIVEEEEEEEATLTLEEYLETKKEVTLFSSSKKEKKIDNEFAGKVARVVDVEEDFLVLGTGKNLRKKKSGNDKKAQTLEINFRVAKPGGDDDNKRDGPRRGGRDGNDRRGGRDGNDRRGGRDRRNDGRGRGRGGGRGGRRGGRGESFALDANAFPSL